MNTTPQAVFKFLIGVAIAAAICFLVWYFSSVVIYILISAVLSITCRPLVRWLSNLKIRNRALPRSVAATLGLLTIWVVFGLLCMLLVPLISNKVAQLSHINYAHLASSVSEPLLRMEAYLQRVLPHAMGDFSLQESLITALQSVVDLSTIPSAFTSLIGFLGSAVITFFSVSFITFFFMKEDGLFFSIVQAMFPERYSENVDRAMNSITHLLSRYFGGILAESMMLMTAVMLILTAFGMKLQDAAFIGLIMGVMNVVPYAGPLIGGLMSLFMGLIHPIEGMTLVQTSLIIGGTLITLKGLDDFILQPTLYSERVNAHPLEVFLVILLAGSLAGILGMLLAIPAYTVLRVFAKEFFSQFALVRKLTHQI